MRALIWNLEVLTQRRQPEVFGLRLGLVKVPQSKLQRVENVHIGGEKCLPEHPAQPGGVKGGCVVAGKFRHRVRFAGLRHLVDTAERRDKACKVLNHLIDRLCLLPPDFRVVVVDFKRLRISRRFIELNLALEGGEFAPLGIDSDSGKLDVGMRLQNAACLEIEEDRSHLLRLLPDFLP